MLPGHHGLRHATRATRRSWWTESRAADEAQIIEESLARRLWALDTIVTAAPLLGLVGMGGAFAYALYALYARLVLEESPQGFTALVVMIVFLASVQLLFLGVLGEYLGRVYEEVKRRPHYIVGEVVRRRGAPAGSPPAGS